MKPHLPTAFAACVLLIDPAGARAQPLFHHAESIERTVANADSVVLGTVAGAEQAADGVTLTLAVEETLKGEHLDRLRVRLPGDRPVAVPARGRPARLLVAASGDPPAATRVIELSGRGAEVLAADFTLLRGPEDVLRAAREAVRRMPGVHRIDTFRLVVPARVAAGTRWEPYYGSGGYITLEVPVDGRLEQRAHEAIRSESYGEREEGARALRYFKSDENVARARALLADPGWAYAARAEENRGIEVRIYGVREAAYRALRSWGVAAAEPVTREEVVKLGAVRTVDLSNSRVGDADLDGLSRFPNLEDLSIRNAPVIDASLRRLARLKGLRSLDLGGTAVTDAGLKELAELAGLRHLSLRGTEVTGTGMRELAGLGNLTSLDLGQTRVSDAGLRHLAGMKGLRELELGGSEVSDGGIAELRRLRPGLKVAR
jgi:hypothetical protein